MGIKIVGTTGAALNIGFTFDDETFEFSLSGGGSLRVGVEVGTDISFSAETSSTKGRTASLKGTPDASIGGGDSMTS